MECLDHLTYNNPYERFMLMILERMDKLEDRMMLLLGNINEKKGVCYVLRMKTFNMDITKHDSIKKLIHKYFDTDMLVFAENEVQMLVHNNKSLVYLDDIMKDAHKIYDVRIGHIGIENCLNLETGMLLLNGDKKYRIIEES